MTLISLEIQPNQLLQNKKLIKIDFKNNPIDFWRFANFSKYNKIPSYIIFEQALEKGLIEEGMPVVVLTPRDNYYKKTISNMQEVIARGAKVLLITSKSKDEVVSENIWETIEVENTNDDLLPFLLTIPLQKLAYYSALKKGYDIDKPRNLAKSVTVE